MAKRRKVRVIIVDDHEMVRKGLRSMLASERAIQVVGEASSGAEAITLVDEENPDVVLMDLKMPQMDGLEATRRIRDKHPSVAVVLLSAYVNETYIQDASRAGAAGYILKDASRELIGNAIRAIHDGALLFSRSIVDSVTKGQRGFLPIPMQEGNSVTSRNQLTPREQEVLKLLVEGLTNKEIGAKLYIAELTVKKHVQSIITKLGVSDRTEAAVKTVRKEMGKPEAR